MDLTETAGFALGVDLSNFHLHLNAEPSVRTLAELEPVVFDRQWWATLSNGDLARPVYYMYRDVASVFRNVFEKYGVRVDLTVIPPLSMGIEPVKTLGHFHPLKPSGKPYPEIYQVLHGRAVFLDFQPSVAEGDQLFNSIERAVAYTAQAREFVVLNLGGHVTINPGRDPVVMINLVSSSFSSIYDPILRMAGAPYFLIKSGGTRFVKNENYTQTAPLEEKPAQKGKPVYTSFADNPEKFRFLWE